MITLVRSRRACDFCRLNRIKCDGSSPCSSCLRKEKACDNKSTSNSQVTRDMLRAASSVPLSEQESSSSSTTDERSSPSPISLPRYDVSLAGGPVKTTALSVVHDQHSSNDTAAPAGELIPVVESTVTPVKPHSKDQDLKRKATDKSDSIPAPRPDQNERRSWFATTQRKPKTKAIMKALREAHPQSTITIDDLTDILETVGNLSSVPLVTIPFAQGPNARRPWWSSTGTSPENITTHPLFDPHIWLLPPPEWASLKRSFVAWLKRKIFEIQNREVPEMDSHSGLFQVRRVCRIPPAHIAAIFEKVLLRTWLPGSCPDARWYESSELESAANVAAIKRACEWMMRGWVPECKWNEHCLRPWREMERAGFTGVREKEMKLAFRTDEEEREIVAWLSGEDKVGRWMKRWLEAEIFAEML